MFQPDAFRQFWLSEGEMSTSEEASDEIAFKRLNIGRLFWEKCAEDPQTAPFFKKALKQGLPPLPNEAKHANGLNFLEPPTPPAPLATRKGTNFWENLAGETLGMLEVSNTDMSFLSGAENMTCRRVTVKRMSGDMDFSKLPKLSVERNMVAYLNLIGITDLNSAWHLGDSFASYLKEVNAGKIEVFIRRSSVSAIDPVALLTLLERFPQSVLELDETSLPHGFLDSHTELYRLLKNNKFCVENKTVRYRKKETLDKKLAVTEDHKKRIVTDIPPFRKTSALETFGLPVMWGEHPIYPAHLNRHRILQW